MSKISIIVPTYNVEQYLKECMDSILNQTLKDIEIICVDDGSTDNSGKILDDYAACDNRIKVIHKENGGYGKAMNVGFDNATGEYIGIVEPDDWIEPEMFEIFYNIATENNLDFIKGNYYNYSTVPEVKNEILSGYNKNRVLNQIIRPLDYAKCFCGGASIWSAIYSNKFLKSNNIRFLETSGASFQDTSFWIRVLFETNRGMFVDKAFNHYRIDNQNSSVKSDSKIFCICDEMHILEKIYKKDEEKIKIINALKMDKYNWNYNRLSKKSRKIFYKVYQKEIIPILKNNFYNLELAKNEVKTCTNIIKSQKLSYKLLSVTNQKKHKVIKLLGLKVKIKSRELEEQEKIKKLNKKVKKLENKVADLKSLIMINGENNAES